MHPNNSQIKEFLGAERLAPNILSSKIITEFALRNGQLKESLYLTSLIGEAIFRRDIFHGNVSDELKDFISRDDVQARVSDPDVLKYIRNRKESFDQAHGIIAVVYTGSKEALPIAFKITTKDTDKEKGVFDSTSKSNQKIQDWSEHLLHIAKGKYAKLNNVTISAPLGPFRAMLDGRSHMLALAIAMDRFINASHHPKKATEVIATGEIDNDIIQEVKELKEKQELAQKMGSKFVTIPKDSVTVDFEVEKDEKFDSFIKRWNKSFGPSPFFNFLKQRRMEISIGVLVLGIFIHFLTSTPTPKEEDFSHRIICNHHDCNGTLFQKLDKGKFYYACSMYWQNRGNKLMCGKKEDRTTPLICKNHKKNELVALTKNGLEVLGCPLEKCDYQFSFVQCKKHSDSKMVFMSDGKSSLLKCPKSGCDFSYKIQKTKCEKHNQEILDFHSSSGQKTDGCPRCNYYSAEPTKK